MSEEDKKQEAGNHEQLGNEENNSRETEEDKQTEVAGPRVFVVGLGQTGREVLYRLCRKIDTIGMDTEEKEIDLAGKGLEGLNDINVKLLHKDGTSRITWNELELSEDDTVVATSSKDNTNLEVCRIAREYFGVKRLIAIIHHTEKSEEYAAAGVETVNRSRVIASFMEAHVFKDRRTAFNIGLGEGEIMEVPILPGSSVVGRHLSRLPTTTS